MITQFLERRISKINDANSVTTPTSEVAILASNARYMQQEVTQPWYLSLCRISSLNATKALDKANMVDSSSTGLCIVRSRGNDTRITFNPKVVDGLYGSNAGKSQAFVKDGSMFAEVLNNNPKSPTVVSTTTTRKNLNIGPTNLAPEAGFNNSKAGDLSGPIGKPDEAVITPIGPMSLDDPSITVQKDVDKEGKVTKTKYVPVSPQGQNIQTGAVLIDNTTLRLSMRPMSIKGAFI